MVALGRGELRLLELFLTPLDTFKAAKGTPAPTLVGPTGRLVDSVARLLEKADVHERKNRWCYSL